MADSTSTQTRLLSNNGQELSGETHLMHAIALGNRPCLVNETGDERTETRMIATKPSMTQSSNTSMPNTSMSNTTVAIPHSIPLKLEADSEDKDDKGDKMSLRLLIDQAISGRLLGRGGETATYIRQQSGAKLDIQSSIRGAVERIICVHGTAKDIFTTLYTITDILAYVNDENKWDIKTMMATPFPPEDPLVPTHSIVFLLHKTHIGCIVGRSGAEIRKSREISQSQITVSENSLPGSMEKTVLIRGTRSSVHCAMKRLVDQLSGRGHKLRPHQKLLYVPQSIPPTADLNQRPPTVHRIPTTADLNQRPLTVHRIPTTADLNQRPPTIHPIRTTADLKQCPPDPRPNFAPDYKFTTSLFFQIQISVSNNRVGAIVGIGGKTIRHIRRRSGTRITIAPFVPDSHDRIITIIGTVAGNQTACALIHSVLFS